MQYPCRTCQKYGHWARDHLPDGTLKPGKKSFDRPGGACNEHNHSNDKFDQNKGALRTSGQKTISFSSANVVQKNIAHKKNIQKDISKDHTKPKPISPIAPNVARQLFQNNDDLDLTDWSAINESGQLDLGPLSELL